MKHIFSTLLAASLALLTPQLAEACPTRKQLSLPDIAFADVIFEGSLTDVKLVSEEKNADWASSFLKLTFDVQDVVRGELHQDEIEIGWIPARFQKASEYNLGYFKEHIGETTRVAVSTPQLASLFCKNDEDAGASERVKTVCDYTVDSLKPAFKENIPFVLSNDYICGSLYLFPVQKYEDMRNYEKNYKAYKAAREIARKEERTSKEGREAYENFHEQRYREMVPQSGLAWRYSGLSEQEMAVHLASYHDVFFTPELRTNMALKEALVDFSMAVTRDKNKRQQLWFDRNQTDLARFREDLKEEVLRLLGYMEKDPNYRNRLLLED